MKRLVSVWVALALLCTAGLPAQSQHVTSNQLLQGTQLRLVLLNGLSTSVARTGDPFIAVVAEPVYVGGQLVLPAGSRVNGRVVSVIKPARFSLFRGQAAMNLAFRSIEVERREIPAQMSILAIQDSSAQATGKKRKDLRVDEGQVVVAKPDIMGDLATVGLGAGGGTAVGAVFSHVVRGLTIGLIGSTTYIIVKKGKAVELPAQTALLVRMDNTLNLPTVAANVSPYINAPR